MVCNTSYGVYFLSLKCNCADSHAKIAKRKVSAPTMSASSMSKSVAPKRTIQTPPS